MKLHVANLVAGVVMLLCCNAARAEYEEFIVSTDIDGLGVAPGAHFLLRDGTRAPVGLKVQKCHSGPGGHDAFAPPVTNSIYDPGPIGYITNIPGNALAADCMDYEAGRTWMGDDDSSAGPLADADTPGFVAAGIYCADASRIGWLRAFSARRIAAAAYYGDAQMGHTALDQPGQINVAQGAGSAVIATVNPAYSIPFAELPSTDGEIIRGRVNACAGGDCNQLPTEWLLIEYRVEGRDEWTVLDRDLSSDGEFQGLYPATTWPVWLRARIRDEHTPSTGLPVSPAYLLEPGTHED